MFYVMLSAAALVWTRSFRFLGGNSRLSLTRRSMAVAALCFACCCLPQWAYAQSPTGTGFYYPVQPRDRYDVGYHKIGGLQTISKFYGGHFMSPGKQRTDPQTGKLGKYLDDSYHNGYDIMANYGAPVYPITGGFVKQLSHKGWSSNGGTINMAVIMVHTTADGRQFRALYGHIETATLNPKVKVDAWIDAGTSIGKVGTWNLGHHLHFGINVLDVNQPLPYKGPDATTPTANTIGYGGIGINHWQGYWPDRKGWIDPVFFIETTSPDLLFLNTDDFVAKSDMKQYLVARFDSGLIAHDGFIGNFQQDQYYVYSNQWFFKQIAGQWHWVQVWHATYKYDKSVRWIIYQDWDTQQVFGWFQIVVFP